MYSLVWLCEQVADSDKISHKSKLPVLLRDFFFFGKALSERLTEFFRSSKVDDIEILTIEEGQFDYLTTKK
jgi:hypothetical protein